ncbi:ISL3 family transposase [Nonomuraea sp. NBC_00507]|uniref:ISL3 family transposase n=1 Tax=Nonomuraea sp. NBC_00507 TaxID=2976002 RepID=UPI003FA5D97A
MVRQYVRPWRTALPTEPPRQRPPTVRQAAGWFLRNPVNLDPDEQRQLDALCTASPQLAALRTHVRHFAEMMTQRRGRHLDACMTAVLANHPPELHSFVTGLHRDQDAVTAGLTLPYSSGPVEGHVNRIIKTIKRQMYGRAKHDLLLPQARLTGGLMGPLTECVPEPVLRGRREPGRPPVQGVARDADLGAERIGVLGGGVHTHPLAALAGRQRRIDLLDQPVTDEADLLRVTGQPFDLVFGLGHLLSSSPGTFNRNSTKLTEVTLGHNEWFVLIGGVVTTGASRLPEVTVTAGSTATSRTRTAYRPRRPPRRSCVPHRRPAPRG